MEQPGERFDRDLDWQAYDAPLPDDPNDAWDAASSSQGSGGSSRPSSSSNGSSRPPSPAPSSIPGSYVPPHRRRHEYGVLADDEGAVGVISRRGALKKLGAPWDKPGSFRKIQLVPYSLQDSALKYMQKNFPNTFFNVTKDHNHDHPIAHLETMIATRQAIDTIPDGSTILDVFGNPRARDSFMNRRDLRGRTMQTVVNYFSEKDYLRRATKWGPMHDATGAIRYHVMGVDDMLDPQNAAWAAQFDVFLMIHTGYYIELDKLAALLSRREGSIAKMIIHRHPAEQGKMFNGECEYVNRHGFVVQRNVGTGERYIHPSLEWMFHSTTKVWRSATRALTWTFKKVTNETWILDVACCPNNLDERFEAYVHHLGDPVAAASRMNEEALIDVAMTVRPPSLPDSEVHSQGGVVTLKPSGLGRALRLTNMAYYEYLFASMIGKPRDKSTLADLYALARRENSLTSTFPGAKKFEVPPDEVADHVVAAFLSGVQRETELLGVLRAADEDVATMNKLSSGDCFDVGSTRGRTKAFVKTAKAFNEVRLAKDTFGAILEAVDRVT